MPLPSTTPEAPLSRYKSKRNFKITPEPVDESLERSAQAEALSFVVQKHWASRLHYDFRLELDGVLLSWAVPKGPSYDPAEKRMAVHVEDHPTSYATFEGTIPPKQYGAGTVIVWDRGNWEPVGDPREGMRKGKLVFHLHGEKLAGLWELVRISKPDAKQDQWMLFKKRDAWARPLDEYDVISALPDSVVEHPLGLLEEREPRAAQTPASSALPTEPDLSAATKARLPERLEPQLATLVDAVPSGVDWLIETKFDGYRVMARIERGRVSLFTRGGHDWTHKMEALAEAVQALGIDAGWLDGEIVVFGDDGLPNFNALQNAMDGKRGEHIVYFIFDVPFVGGMDLRRVPLWSRRLVLAQLLENNSSERVRFSQSFDAAPAQMLEAACQMKMEGLMLKRPDATYVSARSDTWLKLKCVLRQEFVICGFTDRSGAWGEVGGLVLGYHEDGVLRHAGNVGTGWDAKTGRSLRARLTQIETDTPALDPADVKPGRWSKRAAGTERWVRPELVVEVAFSEWTPDGHVRHPTYRGLRADKPATAITREGVGQVVAAKAQRPKTKVTITNPERVIDPSTGFKKRDLVHFYESVADWILPHLKDRPVSLVRAPDGIAGQHFFQKHPESRMPGLRELDAALWPGHSALLAVDTPDALLAAAQMNVVEFHTWNSRARRIDQPDRMVFDLDPGEGVSWAHLQEAALLTRAMLEQLGLKCWLKTSGGKGLHVVVPLAPRLDYDVVKGFSQAVVVHMARTIPQRFVARAGASNRVGRIFIDYLRNGHGQTTAAAFSARARPGMGVSMPVSWERLPALKGGAQWSIATAREHLSFQKDDPWADYWKAKQTLTKAMKLLGFSPDPRKPPARRSD